MSVHRQSTKLHVTESHISEQKIKEKPTHLRNPKNSPAICKGILLLLCLYYDSCATWCENHSNLNLNVENSQLLVDHTYLNRKLRKNRRTQQSSNLQMHFTYRTTLVYTSCQNAHPKWRMCPTPLNGLWWITSETGDESTPRPFVVLLYQMMPKCLCHANLCHNGTPELTASRARYDILYAVKCAWKLALQVQKMHRLY